MTKKNPRVARVGSKRFILLYFLNCVLSDASNDVFFPIILLNVKEFFLCVTWMKVHRICFKRVWFYIIIYGWKLGFWICHWFFSWYSKLFMMITPFILVRKDNINGWQLYRKWKLSKLRNVLLNYYYFSNQLVST